MKQLATYRIRILSLFLICFFLTSATVLACTVPVFRYALERWPAFNYTVEIIYTGNLNEEQNEALQLLIGKSKEENGANLKIVEIINHGEASIPEDNLPWIRLFYPVEHRNPEIIWQGKLTKENVQKMVDSPARREIVSRIHRGDAVAWILLKGTDEIRNNKAHQVLKSELEILSKELKLATSATDVNGNLLDIDVINRGVHFSMVSFSRDDPEEEIFIKMLIGTEPDLRFVKTPMAFPVFGRGRVLFALVGAGIKPKLIRSTCNSVIGWCSCTVKEDNPGADLLFTANWEKAIGDSTWVQDVEMPEITGISDFVENKTQIVEEEKKRNTNEVKKEVTPVEIEKEAFQKKNKKENPEAKLMVDPAKKNEEPFAKISVDNEKNRFNPLYRNISIAIAALIFVLFAVSLYFKRKGLIVKNEDK